MRWPVSAISAIPADPRSSRFRLGRLAVIVLGSTLLIALTSALVTLVCRWSVLRSGWRRPCCSTSATRHSRTRSPPCCTRRHRAVGMAWPLTGILIFMADTAIARPDLLATRLARSSRAVVQDRIPSGRHLCALRRCRYRRAASTLCAWRSDRRPSRHPFSAEIATAIVASRRRSALGRRQRRSASSASSCSAIFFCACLSARTIAICCRVGRLLAPRCCLWPDAVAHRLGKGEKGGEAGDREGGREEKVDWDGKQ